MDSCIEILREQVDILKQIYYGFVGSYDNLMTFSNYTITNTDNRLPIYIKEYKKINKKLRNLQEIMIKMRDEVAKL